MTTSWMIVGTAKTSPSSRKNKGVPGDASGRYGDGIAVRGLLVAISVLSDLRWRFLSK